MNLKNYIESLNQFKKEYGNLEIVYAVDDEGNAFNKVLFAPTLGQFDNGKFISSQDFSDLKISKNNINSICIN